jgi:hypothetical protein
LFTLDKTEKPQETDEVELEREVPPHTSQAVRGEMNEKSKFNQAPNKSDIAFDK